MAAFGYPVVFDVTHAIRKYGVPSADPSGGARQYLKTLARAGVAADSADIKEIEEAFKLGFLTGLTTTPTFMHREGVKNVDDMILKLSKIVPVLQIEALGSNADEIYREAVRQNNLGLDKEKTVYKIPVTLEGVKACNRLVKEGYMVNIHLVYTLQQAYMAMAAGATYICPLVGRLQDQGHDALELVKQCVEAVEYYSYDSKIMFSSVRHAEHVRNALNIGVHACTVPWKVMKALTDNNFTSLGIKQFVEHTRLISKHVADVIDSRNPVISAGKTVSDALVVMTEGGFGAVTVTAENGDLSGIFTDGDLRRLLKDKGNNAIGTQLHSLALNKPITITPETSLEEASKIFKERKVDTLVVVKDNKPVGMLDIQDVVKYIQEM
ncbi:hypothetical protein CHS0354_001991 [Potamilus streckersoni]|uniref:CBS domain-containing protein n=1 Tax=Potamilus streckersoni TaxID=2493646 RepID=A0AAE0W6Q9_9BIVA|nr:hypothetical protein CHS0354_001991 [Potamilus streckersoni]